MNIEDNEISNTSQSEGHACMYIAFNVMLVFDSRLNGAQSDTCIQVLHQRKLHNVNNTYTHYVFLGGILDVETSPRKF